MQNRLYIFPKASILLNLSSSKDQILEFVGSKIDHIDNFKYLKTERLFKDFEGIIGEDDFKIRRIPSFGYSSFLLILHGTILVKPVMSEIQFILRFHKNVEYFLLTMFFFLLLLIIISPFNAFSLRVLEFILFVYSIILIIFNYEVYLMRKNFIEMLKEKLN